MTKINLLLRGAQRCYAPEDFGAAAPLDDAAGPAPEAPASEPTSEPVEDIQAIIDFDPFAPKEAAPGPSAQEPAPAGSDAAAAPTPDAPPAVDPMVDLVARQTQLMEQLAANAAPAPAAAPAEPEAPRFAVALPPEIVNAIRSDDPAEATAALNLIVNGIATMAFNESRKEIALAMQSVPQQFQQLSEAQSEMRRIQADFYGTYPELDREELRPLVVKAAELEAKAAPYTGWSKEFGTRVAQRVASVLAPKAAPAPAPKPPQFQGPSSARPAAAKPNDIMDTLFS